MIQTNKVLQKSVEFIPHFSEKTTTVFVTQWCNGEGFDINIEDCDGKTKSISLSYQEASALNMLVAAFDIRTE